MQDRFDSSRSHVRPVRSGMVLPHNGTGFSDTIKIMPNMTKQIPLQNQISYLLEEYLLYIQKFNIFCR